jgi:hypothetical protein
VLHYNCVSRQHNYIILYNYVNKTYVLSRFFFSIFQYLKITINDEYNTNIYIFVKGISWKERNLTFSWFVTSCSLVQTLRTNVQAPRSGTLK